VGLSEDLSTLAGDGEVLVSRTIVDLVAGSGLTFEPRGTPPLARDGGLFDVFAAGVPA
jgi:hypothetical protein